MTSADGVVPRSVRSVTVVYGVTLGLMGLWAAFAPASFHRDFPLPGAAWVSTLGPFDEHVVRDFGGALVGLSFLGAWLGLRSGRREIAAAAVAWLFAAGVHLAYHLSVFDAFPTISALLQALGLIVSLLVPAGLLAALSRAPAAASADGAASD
jgi:hypothetical protein